MYSQSCLAAAAAAGFDLAHRMAEHHVLHWGREHQSLHVYQLLHSVNAEPLTHDQRVEQQYDQVPD